MKQSSSGDATRVSAAVLSLGLNVVVATFLFGFLGHWVGNRVGADEALTLVGGVFGLAAGLYNLYVHLAVPLREDQEKKSG